jgi:hypothetical protein
VTPDGTTLLGAMTDMGFALGQHSDSVVAYMKARTEKLAAIVHEPGYGEALAAEAESVALFALGETIDKADQLDAMLVQTFRTALAIGVRVLV